MNCALVKMSRKSLEKVPFVVDGKTYSVSLEGVTTINCPLAMIKLKKHGQKGIPHAKILCLDYKHGCMFWVKTASEKDSQISDADNKHIAKYRKQLQAMDRLGPLEASRKAESRDVLWVWDMIDLVVGKRTSAFQRRLTARGVDQGRCISVIGLHRTLDLELPDEKMALLVRDQILDFYDQMMPLPLSATAPKGPSLDYRSDDYSAIAAQLHGRILAMYKDIDEKWNTYMQKGAAHRIVKDYPRLAKNIRIWKVTSGCESGGGGGAVVGTGVGVSLGAAAVEPCSAEKGAATRRVRVDSAERGKNGWGENVIEVMKRMAAELVDAKRASRIVSRLERDVRLIEGGKDRETLLNSFFLDTFTNRSGGESMMDFLMGEMDENKPSVFTDLYLDPAFLCILKVCNQDVLIPAAAVVKCESLKGYRTRDVRPNGWKIDIEFHDKTTIFVHQIKREMSSDDDFKYTYRLSFKFTRPITKISDIQLRVENVDFKERVDAAKRHDITTRLMCINRISRLRPNALKSMRQEAETHRERGRRGRSKSPKRHKSKSPKRSTTKSPKRRI